MDPYLIWALVLFGVGMLIAVTEVILPSAGLLAIAAIGALLGSLLCAYQLSPWAAAAMAAVEAVCVPAVVALAFKVLPRTSVGKRLILSPPGGGPAADASGTRPAQFAGLLNQEGLVVTPLRPSGTIEIAGRRYSVVTNGEMIDTGGRVRVTQVEGARVVVESI